MRKYRTPLRYPGGKQRLAPFVKELLAANDLVGGHYVEPYAGGAGVAMELLCEDFVSRIHLNDSSFPIYAFWKAVVCYPDELCGMISSAPLTVAYWRACREIVRDPSGHDELDVGFATFYLNRCNRSGVLNGGVIGGLLQEGRWKLDARFPRPALIQRVQAIARRADRIVLRNWDAEYFMRHHLPGVPTDALVYCDPPYYDRNSRLYLDSYSAEDHARLARYIRSEVAHRWIVSYDAHPNVLSLYRGCRAFVYDLQYNASRVYVGREVFVFSDRVQIPASSSLSCIRAAQWVA